MGMAKKRRTLADVLGIDRDKLNAKMDAQRARLDQYAADQAAKADEQRAELDQQEADRRRAAPEKFNLGRFLNAHIGAGQIAILDTDPSRYLAEAYSDRGGIVHLPATATLGKRMITVQGTDSTTWVGWIGRGYRPAVEAFANRINELSARLTQPDDPN